MSALSGRQQSLLEASHTTARRVRAAAATRPDPPRPGDLYHLAATADLPVHWVLLEEQPDAFRVVPADTHPLLGAHDLTLETAIGVLRLRPQVAALVPRAALDPTQRHGSLSAEQLAQVQRHLGTLSPPEAAGPAIVSPEIQDWMDEVIEPARAQAGSSSSLTAKPAPRWRIRWLASAALAAGLLGLLALPILGWILQQHRAIDRLLAERTQDKKKLEQMGRDRTRDQATAAALREKLAAAQRSLQSPEEPLLNQQVAILNPALNVRGDEEVSQLPPAGSYLFLVLHLEDTSRYPAYRLVLERRGQAGIVWQSDAVELSSQASFQLALPRRLLDAGSYTLSAYGLRAGEARKLAEYALLLAR